MQKTEQQNRVQGLASRLGSSGASEFAVGGAPISELAERFDTPFYVYNGDAIVRQAQRLRSALGSDTDIYFSLKANPSLGVCQLIAAQGVGAEVASIGELFLAQKAGFPAQETIFAGPGKTNEELELATRLGIFSVNVESEGELGRLGTIAERAGKPMGAGIRINPALQIKGAQMRMGGGPQQFGIDEERVEQVIARFAEHPYLRVRGPHVFAGTQMFDVEAVAAHFSHVVELAQTMADALGRPVEMIDFGGGFGVPYFEGMSEFDLEGFGKLYAEIKARCQSDGRLKSAKLAVELGRYLVAESGVYVTKVVDIKESRGKRFIVTDGGMNHHTTATGNFGQVFRKPYPVALVSRLDAPDADSAAVVGPCCTPLDVIAQNIPFPDVRVGDLIGIFYSGAYGYSASSLNFLSHPTPAEVLVWDGRVHELRPAGRPDAFLDGQRSIS